MPHVRVESSNIDLEVNENESIFRAAWHAGYHWPTTCNGGGSCLICWTLVEDGEDNLSPVTPYEQEQIDYLKTFVKHEGKPIRLACQAFPHGDVTVRKSGVRRIADVFKKVRKS